MEGTWFYGRSLFAVAPFDGLCAAAAVPMLTFLVWIEIFGLPPALITEEAAALVGATLGVVEELDKPGIQIGVRVRVLITHGISDPIKQAYPPLNMIFAHSLHLRISLSGMNVSLDFAKCVVCWSMEQGDMENHRIFRGGGAGIWTLVRWWYCFGGVREWE
ncbi:hypothetical protein ACLB2K_028004 [Fragaria x ananassa]